MSGVGAAERALMLEDRLGVHSVRSVAVRVGLDPNVLTRTMRGQSWPNALPLLRICAELSSIVTLTVRLSL